MERLTAVFILQSYPSDKIVMLPKLDNITKLILDLQNKRWPIIFRSGSLPGLHLYILSVLLVVCISKDNPRNPNTFRTVP